MKNIGNEVKMECVTSSMLAWEREEEVKARPLSHLVTKGIKSITWVWSDPMAGPSR